MFPFDDVIMWLTLALEMARDLWDLIRHFDDVIYRHGDDCTWEYTNFKRFGCNCLYDFEMCDKNATEFNESGQLCIYMYGELLGCLFHGDQPLKIEAWVP